MSDIKRFFKHSSIYAIGNIINRIGAFILLPVYTNYLSVGEYGIIEIFYVISSVISGVLAVGLAHATLRFYFEYKDISDRNSVVSTNMIGSFVISVVGTFIIAITASNIASHMFNSAEYVTGIYIILVTLIFELSSQICLAYIRAIEYSMFFVLLSIAKLIIQISVNTYLVVVEGAGVTGVLLGNMITVAVGWAVLASFTIYKCGIRFEYDKFKPIMKYSFPFLLSTVFALISSNVDKFTLSYLVSIEALGIYALALKFSMILEQLVGEPFSRSYGAFRYTVMNNEGANTIQASIVKYLLMLTLLLALCICYFAGNLLHIMSAKEFWAAEAIVPLVIVSSIIKIMIYPEQSGILFSKNTRYFFYFTLISAAVSVIANVVFISYYGLIGACFALIITDLTILFLTHKVSAKFFPVSYEYMPMLFAIGITCIFFTIPFFVSLNSEIMEVLIKLLLVVIYILILFRLPILNLSEKQNVKEFIVTRLNRA